MTFATATQAIAWLRENGFEPDGAAWRHTVEGRRVKLYADRSGCVRLQRLAK
jgi:hypothetical protein